MFTFSRFGRVLALCCFVLVEGIGPRLDADEPPLEPIPMPQPVETVTKPAAAPIVLAQEPTPADPGLKPAEPVATSTDPAALTEGTSASTADELILDGPIDEGPIFAPSSQGISPIPSSDSGPPLAPGEVLVPSC